MCVCADFLTPCVIPVWISTQVHVHPWSTCRHMHAYTGDSALDDVIQYRKVGIRLAGVIPFPVTFVTFFQGKNLSILPKNWMKRHHTYRRNECSVNTKITCYPPFCAALDEVFCVPGWQLQWDQRPKWVRNERYSKDQREKVTTGHQRRHPGTHCSKSRLR